MSNPYNYHLPVQSDEMFYGRSSLLRRLADDLTQPTPISAALFGGRRSGKTSLLRKLERDMRRGTIAAGSRRLIPWYYDPQAGYPIACGDDFFLLVLEELRQVLCPDKVPRKVIEDTYGSALHLGPVHAFEASVALLSAPTGERFRLVMLVDEAETLLTASWGADLRPNLRNLLSNSSLVSSVGLVMAGSTTFHDKVAEKDSPLENILTRYSLTNLRHEEAVALAREPSGGQLSDAAAEQVWIQTGGHPCLVQFVMHELWYDLPHVSVEDVQDVASTFSDVLNHFERWSDALSSLAHDAYAHLVRREEPATHTQLRRAFPLADGSDLQCALDVLVYHGMVQRTGRGRRTRYGTAGQMFRDWYLAERPVDAAGAPSGDDQGAAGAPPPLAYDTFDVEVETCGSSRYQVQVLGAPAGAVRSEPVDFDPTEPDLRAMLQRVEIGDVDAALLTEVGRRLHAFLFAERVHTVYVASREVSRRRDRGLCLKLRLHQRELAALPWELLYDAEEGRFPALSEHTPLTRSLPGVIGAASPPAPRPRRMLLVTASPDDWPALAVERERDAILSAVEPLVRAGQVHVHRVDHATPRALHTALHAGHHWLHYIGHGMYDPQIGGGALVLEDEDGTSSPLDVDTLRHLLPESHAGPGTGLRLVFLNACATAQVGITPGTRGLAQMLVQAGVPTAIGMGRPIAESSARAFGGGFYGALAEGGWSLYSAVTEGRRRVMVESGLHGGDWAVPILVTREGEAGQTP